MWVNFNGNGSISIRRSYNVSSLTDYGTGNYGVNISSSLSSANYSVGGVAGYSTTVGARGDVNLDVPSAGVYTYQTRVLTTQATFYDVAHVSVRAVE
jgi:hypothetical protein